MTTIWVTFQQEGWHCWPEAPKSRAYLRNQHRHLFHFRVEIQVGNSDREIELHDFLSMCKQLLNLIFETSQYSLFAMNFLDFSCENIAHELLVAVTNSYPGRWTACEVSEDGECGARVEVRPNS